MSAKRPSLRDESAQSRYRRVSTRMWNDHRVRSLGHPEPHPMHLFMYLLTNPATTGVPGLFRARDIALAMDLGWTIDGFRAAFGALVEQGMVEADWNAGLVWLPNAVKHDPPASPNVVISWGKIVRNDMPECGLLLRAVERIREQLETLFENPEQFVTAFEKAFPKAFLEALAKAFPKALPEGFPKAFRDGSTVTAPVAVSGDPVMATEAFRDRDASGDERLSRSLPESLTRTPTRAQPDARHRTPEISPRAPQGAAESEPSPAGSTDARASSAPTAPPAPQEVGPVPSAPEPALGGAGRAPGSAPSAEPPPPTNITRPKPARGSMLSEAERRERDELAAVDERLAEMRRLNDARLPVPEPMTEPPPDLDEDAEPDWDALTPLLAARSSLPEGVEA